MTLMGLFKLKLNVISTRVYTITTSVVIGCLMSIPAQIMASDDAYLRELEAEAKKTESLNSKQSKTHPPATKKLSQNKHPTKKQAGLEKFEQLLKFERPSTYRFYKRLKQDEKLQVRNKYNKHKDIRETSKLIFHLYFRHK